MLDFTAINWIAVVVLGVAMNGMGMLWFGPLFGKQWAKAAGYAEDMEPPEGHMPKAIAMTTVGNLLVTFFLAALIQGLIPSPWTAGGAAITMMGALQVGGLVWLGMVVPRELGDVAWGGRAPSWLVWNGAYHLVMLLVLSALLSIWN